MESIVWTRIVYLMCCSTHRLSAGRGAIGQAITKYGIEFTREKIQTHSHIFKESKIVGSAILEIFIHSRRRFGLLSLYVLLYYMKSLSQNVSAIFSLLIKDNSKMHFTFQQ